MVSKRMGISVTKHYSLDMRRSRIHTSCGYLQETKLVKIPACNGKGCKSPTPIHKSRHLYLRKIKFKNKSKEKK